MKKTAVIGIVGVPACYGGFESFAEQLIIRLKDQCEFTVYCQKSAYAERPAQRDGVKFKYLPLKANGVQSILYDMLAILDSLRYCDTMLILGVGGCPLLGVLRLFGMKKRVVVNVDGIEWKRAKWSGFAKWYLRFAEKCAVKYSDEVVGDNKVISDYITETYGKSCHLIEYGADSIPWRSE